MPAEPNMLVARVPHMRGDEPVEGAHAACSRMCWRKRVGDRGGGRRGDERDHGMSTGLFLQGQIVSFFTPIPDVRPINEEVRFLGQDRANFDVG